MVLVTCSWIMCEDDKMTPSPFNVRHHHRQSGQNITAEGTGQGITVVDLKTETPNKSLEVEEKQAAKKPEAEASSNQFKNLSKTSAKSSYPEVVTESSHQVIHT